MSRAATVKTGEWTQLLLTAGAGAFPVVVGRTAAGFVGAILTMALDIAIGAIFPRVHAAKLAGALLVVPLLSAAVLSPSAWVVGLWAVPLALLLSFALVRFGQSLRRIRQADAR